MLGLKSNISAHVLTKSWFQILIAIKSMRCRKAGSKSYIPTGIFALTPFQILIEIPSPLLLVGVGFSFYQNFVNPTSFKKGSERRNLPKDGELKNSASR